MCKGFFLRIESLSRTQFTVRNACILMCGGAIAYTACVVVFSSKSRKHAFANAVDLINIKPLPALHRHMHGMQPVCENGRALSVRY